MKKGWLYALLFACLLLLLSALIVSPSEAVLPLESKDFEASLIVSFDVPAILMASAQDDAQWVQRFVWIRQIIPSGLLCLFALVLILQKRDANGRVLVCKRYENSVYQLFRQEVAGG